MLADLLKLLRGEAEPSALSTEDQKLALAALMVRVARADHDYAASEVAMIDSVLKRRFELDDAAAAAIRADAETLEAQAPDTVRFTRTIKDTVPYETRDAIAEALWSIALADGDRADEENALLRMVVNLLGITDQDSALARQRAEAAIGSQ
ncbi:putative tellurite resistance protein B-like protein [Rubricella aquisinus]|uniref:Putative tellurite resistance protein B-like protein n=1 Tax=Rubricella aquisinus TaxID=2028108 RepID=A0A840WP62_9RHOB|nr:TerB family tellurite resistance protein [Rubricella aquisinus]MBB5516421.1 putative tellurite resistance protein B-like protein [Rubricella aquisinus]